MVPHREKSSSEKGGTPNVKKPKERRGKGSGSWEVVFIFHAQKRCSTRGGGSRGMAGKKQKKKKRQGDEKKKKKKKKGMPCLGPSRPEDP